MELPARVHTSLATSEAFVTIENALPNLRHLLAASDPTPEEIEKIRELFLKCHISTSKLFNLYFNPEGE